MQRPPLTPEEQKIAAEMRSGMNVSNAVARARGRFDLSTKEIAERARVRFSVVDRIENAVTMDRVRFGELNKIAMALGLEVTLVERQEEGND